MATDKFIDIHTHDGTADSHTISVVNKYMAGWGRADKQSPGTYFSVGIHPWKVAPNWKEHIPIVENMAKHPDVLMVGECGLDKVHGECDMELQKEVFRWHILLSERLEKPLLIHCVKAFDELFRIKKETAPQQLWIVHGFRGKKEQAIQLMRNGIELSFGERFNEDALHEAYECNKLWIETDDKQIRIESVYDVISDKLNCPVGQLADRMRTKFLRVFGK